MPRSPIPAAAIELDLSPADLASRVGAMNLPAILESGRGFGAAGRWSFYAAQPRAILRCDAQGHLRQSLAESGLAASARVVPDADPLAALDHWIAELAGILDVPVPAAEDPPFRGGLIGMLGYDLAPWIERLPRRCPRDSALPDIWFGLYDTLALHDHLRNRTQLVAHDLLAEGPQALRQRLAWWQDRLREPPPTPARARCSPLRPSQTRPEYLALVERVLGYIRAGDIFQANLSQRYQARLEHGDPLDLFLRLRDHSPAPFSAYLQMGSQAVLSASPEWFYQTRGDEIITRPIKGTRPRGSTAAEDARLRFELQHAAKDRAELTMIVDLERNDLGRVCRYGTVEVVGPLAVESFAQVHHLVATVRGRLRPECGPIAVLRAMFPGGSITGAPKIRAMQIIDELEPHRRGLYTGSIGYFSQGASAFNIAIRTLLLDGGLLSYQVGGGIVADSVPELEYDETLNKARGLRAVIEGAGR